MYTNKIKCIDKEKYNNFMNNNDNQDERNILLMNKLKEIALKNNLDKNNLKIAI